MTYFSVVQNDSLGEDAQQPQYLLDAFSWGIA